MRERYDVVICGGGLAGLTLARQLHRRVPGAQIAIVERTKRPLPTACHKVGESTVEVATRYFADELGLRQYLDEVHLPKMGLRFYSGDSSLPLDERVEIGPGEKPLFISYQLDRGRLENDLRAMAAGTEGIDLLEGQLVHAITLAEDEAGAHEVEIAPAQDGSARRRLVARWVVDASGRGRMLAKKLKLARPSSVRSHAAWFRIAEGGPDIQNLVDEGQSRWHSRDIDNIRWLATNHLVGAGYWVWIIPLSSGHRSYGIVAEDEHHGYLELNTPAKARAWLKKHEPALAAQLEGKELADFKVVRDYAHSIERFLSAERWACVGEAALFVDPLYSPGSDFIAFTNSFTTRAIERDLAGETIEQEWIEGANEVVLALGRDLERTLTGLRTVFVHPEVFSAKLWWDYYNYWSYMAPFFFQRLWALDAKDVRVFRELRVRYEHLNGWVQDLVKAWGELVPPGGAPTKPFVPLPMGVSTLTELHFELSKPKTPAECEARMRRDLGEAEEMLIEILIRALNGVGPDNAGPLAAKAGLERWDIDIDWARVRAEEAARKVRRDHLPRIGRDMERAMGRSAGSGTPVAELMALAGLTPPKAGSSSKSDESIAI